MTERAVLDSIVDLPGGDRVARGLHDFEAGREILETLWLQMASGRLAANAIEVPDGVRDVHLELFRRCVAAVHAHGHATYRALNEEL